MIKRILGIVVALVVIALGAGIIHQKRRVLADLPPPENPPVPVVTATVAAGAVADTVQTVALVQSDRAATVAAQVGGTLLEVRLREGAHVKRGQVMARIDPRLLQDAAAAAQARLAAATEDLAKQQAVFTRDAALFGTHDIAQQAFDISKAQLAAAQANRVAAQRALESARTLRSYSDVRAPYDGVVTARLVEPGDLATVGKPLFTMQVPGPVRMLSKLSQELLAGLRAGGAVTFTANGQRLAATTTRIYPALDATHLGGVETELAAAPFGLPAGATVAAAYATTPAAGLVVPSAALLQGLRETLVVRVRDGRTDPVPVTVTGRSATAVTVTGALAPGDVVIVGLPSELMALTAGTRVSPVGR
jgi:RND family efflux transporter MFP subunit